MAVDWTKTLSLDRNSSLSAANTVPERRQPFGTLPTNIGRIQNRPDNFPDLEKAKRSILDSRRAFLKLEEIGSSDRDFQKASAVEEHQSNRKENVTDKKKTPRKVSFKCKKPSNIYWKPKTAQMEANINVAQLASKFNRMIDDSDAIQEELAESAEAIRLKQIANIPDHIPIKRVHRKPSVKTKPAVENRSSTLPRRKHSITRKSSTSKKASSENLLDQVNVSETTDQVCVRTKIICTEPVQTVSKPYISLDQVTVTESTDEVCVRTKINSTEQPRRIPNNVRRSLPPVISAQSVKRVENVEFPSSVRAAIEIFEKRTTAQTPVSEPKSTINSVPKPQVPEKNVKIKTKELVARNGVLKWKVIKPVENIDVQDGDKKTDDNCIKAVNNDIERNCDNSKETANTTEFANIVTSASPSIEEKKLIFQKSTVNSIPSDKSSLTDVNNEKNKTTTLLQKELQRHTISSPQEENRNEYSDNTIDSDSIPVQIINIPLTPPKRCDSIYETQHLRRTSPPGSSNNLVQPNSSFLWRRRSKEHLKRFQEKVYEDTESINSSSTELTKSDQDISNTSSKIPSSEIDLTTCGETPDGYEIPQVRIDDVDDTYDFVDPSTPVTNVEDKLQPPAVPPRPANLPLLPGRVSPSAKRISKEMVPLPEEPVQNEDRDHHKEHNYEYCGSKYEELDNDDGYEYCKSPSEQHKDIYETLPDRTESKHEDGYEYCQEKTDKNEESIYEALPNASQIEKDVPPPLLPKKQEQPLPPRPPSRSSIFSSNCYESIYNGKIGKSGDNDGNYEIICGANKWDVPSNRNSIISCDQQSNSIYGRSLTGWPCEEGNPYSGKANSDLSGSDKSDEWIDISDNEGSVSGNTGLVIVREKQKSKKTGWPQKIRDQWNKSRNDHSDAESDADHHYESLYLQRPESPNATNDDYDSFESESESESSFTKVQHNASGVSVSDSQLPDPPPSQQYKFTKFAASAGKKMKKLKRNWTHHKNDITRSLTWMTRRLSGIDMEGIDERAKEAKEEKTATPPELPIRTMANENPELSKSLSNIAQEIKMRQPEVHANSAAYQNLKFSGNESVEHPEYEKNKNQNNNSNNTLKKNRFLNKFRKSMSLSQDSANELTQNLIKPRSTFYLTTEIDLDKDSENTETGSRSSSGSLNAEKKSSPRNSDQFGKNCVTVRPKCPPPPIPVDANQNIERKSSTKSSSWYSEYNLFKNEIPNNKHPSTSWYAEIGLYHASGSTPSTSSAENSGNNITNVNIQTTEDESPNHENNEQYYNMKNERESNYYNESIDSFSSTDTKTENNIEVPLTDIPLHLEDEPLYQFYDAAILEDVCKDGTTDFDYDGYEEVGEKQLYENRPGQRPTAMQIIAPNRNGVTVARTLWCEIPEVMQSMALNSLSTHQKKIQEAKFEMMTSEASYLNSLNVLNDHFISNLIDNDCLTNEEKEILFGKIPAVKKCSEKLLADLEKCWQDNILLHGICEIIQKHAEENFYVYVSYCENQILLDCTLKQIKERPNCNDFLKQLESSHACQSLTLYSFLMLPMQRITRWPLLLDAVFKRLSPQDAEYLPCQCALATINKIVTQCNEGARKMERITEMKKIEGQLEFGKSVTPFKIAIERRWLVKSGPVTQMQARTDDNKLTFGKKFLKIPLHLFLFNDMLLVTKFKGEDSYIIIHYCMRSYIELNINEIIPTMPAKDMQGRNLLFLTLLENQEGKTVEMLLSCSSESDRERWIEALSPPKSEDPNETLYECWDCPQVTVIHNYVANQPDELTLSRGDVLNVVRKMADGWYHGERIRDGESGWFPSNYTIEVANPHVRARNLKQRYRLLALSESYLKSK